MKRVGDRHTRTDTELEGKHRRFSLSQPVIFTQKEKPGTLH